MMDIVKSLKSYINSSKKEDVPYIYGITDRSSEGIFTRLDDSLIELTNISEQKKSRFYKSLEILINSGLPAIRAIEIIAIKETNKRFKRILQTIHYDMKQRGKSLAEAMSKYPKVFPLEVVRMLMAGENIGAIENTLRTISLQSEKNMELRSRIKSASMYPIIMLCLTIIAVIAVLVLVIPQFDKIFSEFGSDLPIITKTLVWLSKSIQSYFISIGIVIIAIILLFKQWISSTNGSREWTAFLLSMPIIGHIKNMVYTATIAENTSALLASGIPLSKALHMVSEMFESSLIREALERVEYKVIDGKSLSKALSEEEYLDPILSEMASLGEQSGTLPEVLQRIGQQYNNETQAELKNLSTLLEPILLIIVALVVIFLALSILIPLLNINDVVLQKGAR